MGEEVSPVGVKCGFTHFNYLRGNRYQEQVALNTDPPHVTARAVLRESGHPS